MNNTSYVLWYPIFGFQQLNANSPYPIYWIRLPDDHLEMFNRSDFENSEE